jgi:hypothetical protein
MNKSPAMVVAKMRVMPPHPGLFDSYGIFLCGDLAGLLCRIPAP